MPLLPIAILASIALAILHLTGVFVTSWFIILLPPLVVIGLVLVMAVLGLLTVGVAAFFVSKFSR